MDFLAPGRAGFTDEVTHDRAFGAYDSKDPTMDDRMGGFTGSAKAIGQEQGFHKRQKPKKVEKDKKGADDDDDDRDLEIASKLEEITYRYDAAIREHIDPKMEKRGVMALDVDSINEIVTNHLDAISQPMQSLELGTYLDSINELLPTSTEIKIGVGVLKKENVYVLFQEIINKIEEYKKIEKKNNNKLEGKIAELEAEVKSLKEEKTFTPTPDEKPASTTEKPAKSAKETSTTASTTEKKMKPTIEFNRELLASNLKGLSMEKLQTKTGKVAFRLMIALLFGKDGEYMQKKAGLERMLTDKENQQIIGDDMVDEKDRILVPDDKISIGEAAHFALNYKSGLFISGSNQYRLRDLIARMLEKKSKNEAEWQTIIAELEKDTYPQWASEAFTNPGNFLENMFQFFTEKIDTSNDDNATAKTIKKNAGIKNNKEHYGKIQAMFRYINRNTPTLPSEKTLEAWSSENNNRTNINKDTYSAGVNFFGMFGGNKEEDEEDEEEVQSVIGLKKQADVPMQSSSGNVVTAEEGYPDGSGKGSVTLVHIKEGHMEEEEDEKGSDEEPTLASLIWI